MQKIVLRLSNFIILYTQLVEILDSDSPVGTFASLSFPDNNLSKPVTHGNQVINENLSFNKIYDIILTND